MAGDVDGLFRMHGRVYILDMPYFPELRNDVLREAHASNCAMHPVAAKIYYDVHRTYWWAGLNMDVVDFVDTLAGKGRE